MFDDSGECLDGQLMQELAGNLKPETVTTLQEPQFDYYGYRPAEPGWDDGDFGHVLEIYGFPSGFRTEDLISAFSAFQSRGFDVKWVDDEHALGLFNSPIAAQDALAMKHALVRTRPLCRASSPTRDKARRNPEFLQPVRPRPQTSAVLARRLVAGALGVRSGASPEQRSAERRKLQEAKDKKKLVAKQREDIWEGSV
ncbi:coiled-coil domain-containing protein R3HCC1L-like isoform X2 [Lethenteron reissneri]|uniref:coiled-coil domain-containing protein R3HCC1L-like isoform X2 n=1 Tax=Lethenteron reissneri TaxID=7753 RepID=UPI002AB71D8B|nr:coiled-coil domain-containing protein R3HCC1L-like isoform X2 [Lethenteron reissneri]